MTAMLVKNPALWVFLATLALVAGFFAVEWIQGFVRTWRQARRGR